jgi:hypothetical protein
MSDICNNCTQIRDSSRFYENKSTKCIACYAVTRYAKDRGCIPKSKIINDLIKTYTYRAEYSKKELDRHATNLKNHLDMIKDLESLR